MTAEALLADLVGFPSVVGRPNGDICAYIVAYLASHGISCCRVEGPEGDRANLFATIGDPAQAGGIVLSGHLDVVAATEPEWRADPFGLRCDGERLIGRGACDMKGFVAAVLAAVPALIAARGPVPVHLAFSYDEEAGCRGVPHLLARLPELCAPPACAVIGEPTGLAHKGKAALTLTARGVSGHSSRPDLGENAVHKLLPVLESALVQEKMLRLSGQDPRFAPPYSTLQIGVISGGQAVNILPDLAQAQIEARAIAGVEPQDLFAPIIAAAERLGVAARINAAYPALALNRDHPLAARMAAVTGRACLEAVSFGTEAGLYQAAGVASVICGPGDIARAHRPEEYLTRSELAQTVAMILALAAAGPLPQIMP